MSSLWRVFQTPLLLLLGAFLYIVAAPPYEWSLAGWVALTPLFLVVRGAAPLAAFAAGFVYSLLTCAGITYWLYFAIAAYFPFSSVAAFLFTLLSYSVFVGVYIGLASAGACLLMRNPRSWLSWLGVPALWVGAEYARTSLLSGFSWELLGYTQYRHLPLIQLADLTGVYGVSFLLAFSSYVAAEAVVSFRLSPFFFRSSLSASRFPWPALNLLLGGVVLAYVYGAARLHQYSGGPLVAPLSVAVVRSATANAQRWQRASHAGSLLRYISATREGVAKRQPDLIVWPEFAVTFYLDQEPGLRAQLGWLTNSVRAALLLGAPRMERMGDVTRYYNSAYLLSPSAAAVQVYDKIRLVPFAEYRPSGFPTFAPQTDDAPSEFTAGQRATVFSLLHSAFGVTICYEATYPTLSRRLVQNGAQFLVNISNDTWLTSPGDAAAAQHFSMTVFRAVENKRALVRAATAGVSAFIDPVGRVSQRSASPDGVVLGEATPQNGLTVYTRYGDWFAALCLGIGASTLFAVRWQPAIDTAVSEEQDAAAVA
ncbi:MAG: apolipoprotein N-acyltransferase [Deltaproteobacteria bacterium]|nr:apolipoprotein N-acyltransferase [Deltaproteobacteria bacterium]